MTIQSQLDQVLALAEKATPGKWETRSDPELSPYGYSNIAVEGDPEGLCVYLNAPENAKAVVACMNFLREHGPAIRAAVGGEAVPPVAWMDPRSGRTIHANEYSGVVKIGPLGDPGKLVPCREVYTAPLYASPTATVDVGPKDLVTVWRAMVAEADNADVSLTLKHCADELAALIGEKA